MNESALLTEAFARVRDNAHRVVDGLDDDQLVRRVEGTANSIAWLVWHLTRVQDDHVADAADSQQIWLADGWVDRFELPFDRAATGYGHTSEEAAAVRVPAELLTGYLDAVHERTIAFVRGLSAGDLDRVVDERWNPPVTLGVRLISVISDDLQHLGQAAFVRGLV